MGQEFLGIFAIRSTSEVDFPWPAGDMLEILGHLTGLYLRLQSSVRNQTQTYQDFLHQLRNPIFQAHKRIEALASRDRDRDLEPIRGLLGKARRVVSNLRLFANLAAGKEISPDWEHAAVSQLVKPLIEACSDNQILWKGKRLRFYVDRDSFEIAATIQVDMDLFEQAVGNILDNAGKYGEKDTTILAKASLSSGTVRIAFRGTSIPFSTAESANFGKRGWRGNHATLRSAEGSGIGLWMVKHIMQAHSGGMEVEPTDQEGVSEFRLVFPLVHRSKS
jgi:signal transduction histidine kinase